MAYFGSASATAHQLNVLFWECVHVLDNCGFTIEYVMTDGASANRTFFNMLFTGDPRENHYVFKDVYDIEHNLCAIQDIMHVLKKTRNNVESSKLAHKSKAGKFLTLNNKPIIWDHWLQCYNFNNSQGLQIKNKLTDEHFNLTPTSKMRNQLAISVLHRDMLYLMKALQATLAKPEELASSIDLLEHTSILTDIFCNVNRPVSEINRPQNRLCYECHPIFQCMGRRRNDLSDWEYQKAFNITRDQRTYQLVYIGVHFALYPHARHRKQYQSGIYELRYC